MIQSIHQFSMTCKESLVLKDEEEIVSFSSAIGAQARPREYLRVDRFRPVRIGRSTNVG